MNSDEKKPLPPSRIRTWLRRLSAAFMALNLLLLIFHRPLLIAAIRIVAVKIAAKQNVQLTLRVEGSVLRDLRLEDVFAIPIPGKVSPIEKIHIGMIQLRYSLFAGLRHGFSEFLRSYELKDAQIALRPVAGTRSQKEELSTTLQNLLQQPALFSDRVFIEQFSVLVHTSDGDLVIKNANLSLDPTAPGYLRIDEISIPNFHTWQKIAAVTTFKNRDLVMTDLALDDELRFQRLELDAARRVENIHRLSMEGNLFGAPVSLGLVVDSKKKNNPLANISLDARDLSLPRLAAYLHPGQPMFGEAKTLSLRLKGDPNVPASWTGNASSLVTGIKVGATTLERATIEATAADAVANIAAVDVASGKNSAHLSAKVELPRHIDELSAPNASGEIRVAVSEPALIDPSFTSGVMALSGPFTLKDRKFAVKIAGTASEIEARSLMLKEARFEADISKTIPAASKKNEPFFKNLTTSIVLGLRELRLERNAIDTASVRLSSNEQRVHLQEANLARGDNTLAAHGEYELPTNLKAWTRTNFHLFATAHAPRLADFFVDQTAPNAALEANAELSCKGAQYAGRIQAQAQKISYAKFTADSLVLDAPIESDVVRIETLLLAINDVDKISGSGRAELHEPFAYEGQLQTAIRDLGVFNSLFNAAGVKGTVAGSLAVDWSGSGKLRTLDNSGTVSIHLKNGRVAELTPLELDLDGKYSPEIIEIPDLRINTSNGILTASVDLHQQLLSISGISFQQGATGYFSGAITLPVDLQHGADIEKLVPPDRPLSINLQSADLKLETLLTPVKGPAPARGSIGATLDAQGTLDQLHATLTMKGRNLQATATKLAPATLDVAVTCADDRLVVEGAVQQPGIKPLEIRGSMPLPIRQILREKKIDEQTPLDLTIKLPQSPAAFLGQVSPELRFVEGQLGINAAVTGTIAQPQFYGSALLDLTAVRFRQQTMPAISGFKALLEFKDNRLTLNRFGGEISGGTFSAGGRIEFVKLTEPTLDLQFKTANALLLRNDTVTLRADSDIKIAGPLNAAAVTGTLGLTKSRFFREVEILPLELPGRPAPKPPESAPGFSFEKPPLRDWTFDLAIKTKDPFVVRGNLTNGAVDVDLKLIGTGLAPTLDGMARIDNFTASLPFSTLEINYGYVYFSPDNPFIPVLDLQGTSSLRDYNINVYINGEASEPTTVFTSEPPLPQEEIIALLATGTTTAELTGNADVLAGRASVLLFQKFYRKIFKRKEPSENQSVTNRFQFDIGGVDPRTGKQEVSTRFKLTDNLYLIGDLDVQGEVRGQVKYLLRFR